MGPGVGVSGVCVKTAVGVFELVGNAGVAALGPGVGAAVGIKVTVDTGVSVRASSWVGVGSPQAMRDAGASKAPRKNGIFTSGSFSLQVANSNPTLYFRPACRPAPVVIRLPGPSLHVEVIWLSHLSCQYFQPDLSCSRIRSNRTI